MTYLRLVADFCRAVVQQPGLNGYAALWRTSATHPGVVLQAYIQVAPLLVAPFCVIRSFLRIGPPCIKFTCMLGAITKPNFICISKFICHRIIFRLGLICI